ncbi:protein FAM185A isoform X2 [Hetaerina americana]|uniref:protein FAM185A isoform X2 n=1 Tax=Hetaerina americana TaxID=62018 RepID=UPI003A7F4099
MFRYFVIKYPILMEGTKIIRQFFPYFHEPLDPLSLDGDCIIARAYGPPKTEIIMKMLEGENNVIFSAQSTQLQEVKNLYLEVEIPVVCDIDVISKFGDVSVESFVSDKLSVEAENGDINCRKLNCGTMNLKSSNGNIICEGIILGNIKIKAGKLGRIRGANFQGNLLEVETDDGDIDVSSTYSLKSSFITKKGNVSLKNLHRSSFVSIQKGNLSIFGLDGSLDARVQDGNIRVQITQLDADSYLETKNGKVSLSVAKSNVCQLNLSAREILILKETLRSMGEIEHSSSGQVFRSLPHDNPSAAQMKVVSENGEVHLKEESWISSLNLGDQ